MSDKINKILYRLIKENHITEEEFSLLNEVINSKGEITLPIVPNTPYPTNPLTTPSNPYPWYPIVTYHHTDTSTVGTTNDSDLIKLNKCGNNKE